MQSVRELGALFNGKAKGISSFSKGINQTIKAFVDLVVDLAQIGGVSGRAEFAN
jgi:hypothetical protein